MDKVFRFLIRYTKGIILLCILGVFIARLGTGMPAQAHESGPQYIKVNNEFVSGNPILEIAEPTAFPVGADVASSSGYIVGQSVVFVIDEHLFPNPYAQAQNSFGLPVTTGSDVPEPHFRWDFKDGSSPAEGSNVSHVFTKPGTYIVELAAKFEGKSDEYATINTVQMDVYPDKEYEPSAPNIIVNGQTIEDAQRDTVIIKPATSVSFDVTPVGSVFSYHWDFGDGKGAEGKTVTHRYNRDEYFPVAVLRVVDQNNIAVDTLILLDMPFGNPNPLLKIWYAISDFVSGVFSRE